MGEALASKATLEENLQIWEWGEWARPRIHQDLAAKSPGWQALVQTGYRESVSILPIDEDYAVFLDGLIAQLPQPQKQVLLCLYVYRLPLKRLPHIVRRSKYAIRQERDAALSTLYGQLSVKNY